MEIELNTDPLDPASYPRENIDPSEDNSQFAYGENVGWINFKPAFGPGVTVTDTSVTGYAWAENIGWINLHPDGSGVVNDGRGHLSGYAWAENAGWINFAPIGGGVSIDACGEFHGYAWGENIGWISFRSDGANPFRVKTSWVPPIDDIPPVTSPDSPIQGWYNGDVSLTLSAVDECGSGVQEIHYTLDGGTEIITAGHSAALSITSEGKHRLVYYSVDQKGNKELSYEISICVDKTAPAITITSPANGGNYLLNEVVTADYMVTDTGGPGTPPFTLVSGIALINATVPDGQAINTSLAGSHTFTVTAIDKAGNTRTVTHTYTRVVAN